MKYIGNPRGNLECGSAQPILFLFSFFSLLYQLCKIINHMFCSLRPSTLEIYKVLFSGLDNYNNTSKYRFFSIYPSVQKNIQRVPHSSNIQIRSHNVPTINIMNSYPIELQQLVTDKCTLEASY